MFQSPVACMLLASVDYGFGGIAYSVLFSQHQTSFHKWRIAKEEVLHWIGGATVSTWRWVTGCSSSAGDHYLTICFVDKQINELKELLRKKEGDMKAMEDRYKK